MKDSKQLMVYSITYYLTLLIITLLLMWCTASNQYYPCDSK